MKVLGLFVVALIMFSFGFLLIQGPELAQSEVSGTVWFSGIIPPNDSVGVLGDFYLNTDTADIYRKAQTWLTPIMNIKGPQGVQGIQGERGFNGTQGIQGVQGNVGTAGVDGDDGAAGAKGDKGDKGDAGDDSTLKAYILTVQALTSSPGDSVTRYFGNLPKAPVSAAGTSKVYIPRNGTIVAAVIYCYSGTAGTNENLSIYIRLNNSADTLIKTVGVAASERVFDNYALNIPVVQGDYFEIKCVHPLWATNPLTTIFGGYVYVE